jgi:NitT/TauT family transport system ATP-binding protein
VVALTNLGKVWRDDETASTVDSSRSEFRANNVEIDVNSVTIVFESPKGQIIAADRVSFQVSGGEFVCLLGPSGCGKSTVLNAIAGFETPCEGHVSVTGHLVTSPGPDRGMVFQQPNLFPWKTVRQNIAFGPRMLGKDQKDSVAIADMLIEMVGLVRFADAYPHTLSGGMQQRVALARALANKPKVLLMDEPFGALDAQTRIFMQEHLLKLWAQIGTTVVFVTHDVDEAIFLADRVVIMTAGPGHIKCDLRVSLPRPRSTTVAFDSSYISLKEQCLDMIRAESMLAFERQGET